MSEGFNRGDLRPVATIACGKASFGDIEAESRISVFSITATNEVKLAEEMCEDDGGAAPTDADWFEVESVHVPIGKLDEVIAALMAVRERRAAGPS